MRTLTHLAGHWLVLCLLPLVVHAADRRVYMLGNSLTDDVLYDGFASIVTNGGDTLTLGSHRIPGSPINYLWKNPNTVYSHSPYGYYPNAFANYTWDAVTLQPFATFSTEITYARYFAQALRGQATFGIVGNDPNAADVPTTPGPTDPTGINPNATIYIYAQWPSAMTDQWKSTTWLGTDSTSVDTAAFFEAFVPQMRTLEPSTNFYLIPAGHVFHELYQQTRAGRFPGITRQFNLMEDGRHLNDRGSYVPALTFYSVIYQRDPRGMTAPARYGLTSQQAAVVQAAVWKVVSNHPLTGIPGKLVVTTPSLPDALEDTSFTTTLGSALAQGAVTWAVKPGTTLPTGVNLAANGTLSGNVATPGIYDLSVRATDAGGNVADRDYILFVNSNVPPVIANTTLPAAPYGQPYNTLLTHTAGVGDVTWSVTANDLPHGLVLSPDGNLRGTPLSVQNTFNVTFRATDSTGAFSEKVLPITVASPGPATLVAGPAHAAPTIDGALSEAIWTTLPHAISRRVHGATDNTATFAVRHDAAAMYVAVRVADVTVTADDAVHLFINGLHDREAVYNVNDRHIVVHSNGDFAELNGRPTGITAAAAAISGGYSVEIRVPLSNLSLDNGLSSRSVGFDLGVEDVDAAGSPAAWLVWRAAHPTAPSPAVFGNLVLAGGPVSTNLIVNPWFESALTAPGYPGRATTGRAGLGWHCDGVAGRPFTVIDKLGYGYPTKAIIPAGTSPSCSIYQVLQNNRAVTGRGVLRFDVKWASANIAIRLYAYNGTATQVDTAMTAVIQSNPPAAGTPAATLISTTLASIPAEGTWREVSIPVDFGSGYDYYLFAFSASANAVSIDSRIDNVQLGALVEQQSFAPPAADLTFADWSALIPWDGADSTAGGDPDGDGANNLLEYALLGDPRSADPSAAQIVSDGTTLSLHYLRARADLTYAVETSTDLATWSINGVVQDTTTPVGGTATATIAHPSGESARRFLRLRVTR